MTYITLQNFEKLGINLYHPIPFDNYSRLNEINKLSWRKDCDLRFDIIKDSYGDFHGKKLIDIGCANGFFLFRFIQSGGYKAFGVDIDKSNIDFINLIAKEENMNISADIILPSDKFDIGIFLDLFHKDDTTLNGYPDFIGKNCDVAFVSDTNNSGGNIKDLLSLLDKYYKNICFIYKGFQGREIYKCSN